MDILSPQFTLSSTSPLPGNRTRTPRGFARPDSDQEQLSCPSSNEAICISAPVFLRAILCSYFAARLLGNTLWDLGVADVRRRIQIMFPVNKDRGQWAP